MKGKIKIGWLVASVVMAFVLGAVASMVIFNKKDYTATEIYNKTFNSVVEVKAYTNVEECGYGSAVCFSRFGYFLTNAHILTNPSSPSGDAFGYVQIRFPDMEMYEEAKIVSIDKDKDLAIIKYSGEHELNALKIKEDYKTGDVCYALGNAQNYGVSITEGIISKKQTTVKLNNKETNAIQCDLTIAEGNSGGALLNKNGDLIGITTFRTKDGFNNVVYGFCFAIEANTIINYISEHMVVVKD